MIKLSPNPAQDRFTIATRDKKFMSAITISNQSGYVVLHRRVNNSSVTISRNEIGNKPGLYYISAIINGQVYEKELKVL